MPETEVSDIEFFEIILKVVERCNLNCSYCYFFNLEDQNYKKHPPFISMETVYDIAQFLKRSKAVCPKLSTIRIDLHGGEPMLQPKKQFDSMCTILREELSDCYELQIAMQSNGTLVSESWIELLKKHDVSVGISLDGPKEINDHFRVDHRGNGSYDSVIQGLKLLQQSDMKSKPGILSVMNPSYDPEFLYNHFVHDLGIRFLDFLLPDFTHDTFPSSKYSAEDYGIWLCKIFDIWTKEDNPEIQVRFLYTSLGALMGYTPALFLGGTPIERYGAATISSNGLIGPEDTIRNTDPQIMEELGSIKNYNIYTLMNSPLFSRLGQSLLRVPKECQSCCWQALCRGGKALNRYSQSGGFNKPSVYCKGLKIFYETVVSYLLRGGVPEAVLLKSLKINNLDTEFFIGNL